MKKITTIKALDKELKDGDAHDFCILLAGGLVRSSKSIMKIEKIYSIVNEVDDTEQELTAEQIINSQRTNIGEAMRNGAFYAY